MKVRLRDIRLTDLDSHSVILVSSFVRAARVQEGSELRLNDAHVIRKVFDIGLKTRNTKLRTLFLSIRRSIRNFYRAPSEAA